MSSDDENIIVNLGCFGRKDDHFVSCPSVENPILEIPDDFQYHDEIMDYFEGCRLFDKRLIGFNSVRNFLQSMQNRFDQVTRPLWHNKEVDLYQNFLINHKACGVYIRLGLGSFEEFCYSDERPEKIFVKSKKEEPALPQFNRAHLRLIKR